MKPKSRLIVFIFILICFAHGKPLYSQTTIHIWVKAFIPDNHPGNPGYVFPLPANPKLFLIHEPVGSYCASTDSRTFSEDPAASARLTTEFNIVIYEGKAVIEPVSGRPIHSTGESHRFDCTTGIDIEPLQHASTSNMSNGEVAYAIIPGSGVVAQVSVDGRASYPFMLITPDVNYTGTFTYTSSCNTIQFVGSVGIFPAFEAYAQINNGPVQTIFRTMPGKGTTVNNLIEFGTGLRQRRLDVSVPLQ